MLAGVKLPRQLVTGAAFLPVAFTMTARGARKRRMTFARCYDQTRQD
jgi:hypothetical protein